MIAPWRKNVRRPRKPVRVGRGSGKASFDGARRRGNVMALYGETEASPEFSQSLRLAAADVLGFFHSPVSERRNAGKPILCARKQLPIPVR